MKGKKKNLKEKLKYLKEKNKEYLNDLKRVQAEFENFQKRMEKEKTDFVKFASGKIVLDLLSVLDSIEGAEKNLKKDEKGLQGIRAIKKQLIQVLSSHGLKEIESIGKKFNPELHECLMQEKNEKKEDEIVLEELQKGYFLNEKVLRPAKVKINKLN